MTITISRVLLAVTLASATAVLGACVDDPEALEQELTGPLAASPEAVDWGTIRPGTTASTRVTLTNHSRTDVDISSVQILPPDPCLPPGPCFPPDPCRIELLIPCVRPGDSTTMTVSCTPTVSGSMDFTTAVDYRTPSGASYRLSVPFHATVR